jgi:hypothetical protein
MWKNMGEPGRPQMIMWCMHITCWISKATNIHSEYVIYIASLLQRWLPDCISVLHYMYFTCLVIIIFMIHWWYCWQSSFLFFVLHKYSSFVFAYSFPNKIYIFFSSLHLSTCTEFACWVFLLHFVLYSTYSVKINNFGKVYMYEIVV